jgi:hypothetical protein
MDHAINFFVDDGDWEAKFIVVTWMGLTGREWMYLCIAFLLALWLYFYMTDA